MRSHAKAIVAISALLLTLALSATLASAVAPVVSIEDASNVSYTSADLKGTVNPEAQSTTWRFQYIADAQFQENLTNSLPGFEGASTPFEETTETEETLERQLTGLSPSTTYHLRLVAENGDGQSEAVAANTFTTEAVGPPTVTIDPVTEITGTSAKFSGTIDPEAPEEGPGEFPQAFDVEWHFECTPECPGLEGDPIPADSDPHEVEADASGLEPNTNYEVRLVAENAGGQISAGPESFKTAGIAPELQTLYAGLIEPDSAVLAARINPKNSPVTYQFEWGTDDSYGAVIPASSEPLGAADNAFHVRSTSVAGLAAGTTYHFRVVATNTDTAEESHGVDHTFITPAGPLAEPPVRGFEKVSPDRKNGVSVKNGSVGVNAAGNRVAFQLSGNAVDAQSGGGLSNFLAIPNVGGGWSTKTLDPPIPVNTSVFREGVTSEVERFVFTSDAPLASGAAYGNQNLFLSDRAGEIDTLLTPSQSGPGSEFVGAPEDSTRIFYESRAPHSGDAVSDARHIYLWDEGEVRLVDWVDPDDGGPASAEPSPNGAMIGSGELGVRDREGLTRAISRDGRRVVFRVFPPGGDTLDTAGQLYVRTDDGSTATTTHVNASQRTSVDPAGPLPAIFWLAEANHGSKILFTSCEKLTDDSTASNVSAECLSSRPAEHGDPHPGRDLYLFDVETGELSDLTTADPTGANVWGVVGASDSLNSIYFVAAGKLAPGAIVGAPNLYLWENGEIRLVVTLSSDVVVGDAVGKRIGGSDGNNYSLRPFFAGVGLGRSRATRVTPDGSALTFTSRERLTGHENRNPDACAGDSETNIEDRCLTIYRYDASSNELACVSCNPTGEPPASDAILTSTEGFPQSLSSDGDRVFFETLSPLAPQAGDSNGKVDVYVWDRGAIDLLTNGLDPSDSQFVAATPDGSHAFVRTRARLVRRDQDQLADLYDVRVGGGFDPPIPPAGCEGDTCQSPPAPPNDPTPSSSTFRGPGDPRAGTKKRCAKGKVRRGGKCARRKPRGKKSRSNANRRAHR